MANAEPLISQRDPLAWPAAASRCSVSRRSRVEADAASWRTFHTATAAARAATWKSQQQRRRCCLQGPADHCRRVAARDMSPGAPAMPFIDGAKYSCPTPRAGVLRCEEPGYRGPLDMWAFFLRGRGNPWAETGS